MKAPRSLSLLTIALLAAFAILPLVGHATERMTVTFVDPENFRDFRDGIFASPKAQDHLSAEFTSHLQSLGKRYLSEGQRLEVRITEVDLAGEFEPWRGAEFSDIRMLRDIYAPRMELAFRLFDSTEALVKEGERSLIGLGYLWASTSFNRNDPLVHDKTLLTDWFRREFRISTK